MANFFDQFDAPKDKPKNFFDQFDAPVEAAPKEDTGFFDMAGRAVKRGFKQTGSLLGDVLPAMVGKAVGAEEYAARQMAEAAETQKEIEQKYGARYKELSDVKGLGDVLPFVAETVLEQAGTLATSIIPGVGGAVVGGRLAAQQAAKTLAAREATQAGGRYAALKTAQGAAYGGGAGAFLGSYAQNAPEIFQNIYEATKDEATGEGQMALGASMLAGSVSAALDSILPAYLVRQFTPGMKMGVVERILEKSGMAPGIARGATAGVITGAATEAPTEAAQEAISIAAEKFVDEHSDVWNSKDFNRLVESFVRGGVGGGAISGVAGGIKGKFDTRSKDLAFTQGKPGPNALDQVDAGEVEEIGAVTPAAPPVVSPEVEDLRTQIAKVSGAIRDLENRGADEAILADWYAERDRLQAQERALRRGEGLEEAGILRAPSAREQALQAAGITPEQIQAKREEFGEPGKLYKVTPDESTIGVTTLVDSGVFGTEAEKIASEIKKGQVSGKTKAILRNISEGKVLFPDGWRVPTEQDYAQANKTTQDRFNRIKSFSESLSQKTLLAQQMGLELAPAEGEVPREFASPIELSEQEFALTAPEGRAPREVEIETEAAPPAAPLNLVNEEQATKPLYEMLTSLEPVAEAEQGVKNHKAAVDGFLDEIKEYIADVTPQQRKDNLGLINDFFNSLGVTSSPELASNLPRDLKGKSSTEQADIIAQRTRMPNLTRLTGINELRAMFKDFMEQQNVAKVGEFPGRAATRTFASDI